MKMNCLRKRIEGYENLMFKDSPGDIKHFNLSLEKDRTTDLDKLWMESKYFPGYSYSKDGDERIISYESDYLNSGKILSKRILDRIQKLVESYEVPIDWERVASEIGNGASAFDCFLTFRNASLSKSSDPKWSREEELLLSRLVDEFGTHSWNEVSRCLETRNPSQCLRHYQQIFNRNFVKSDLWNPEEDKMLRYAVEMYGSKQWQHVANCIPRRTASQCMSRWRKCVNEHEYHVGGAWSNIEDRRLALAASAFEIHSIEHFEHLYGAFVQDCDVEKYHVSKLIGDIDETGIWRKIARCVPGRDETRCRERWSSHVDPSIKRIPFTPEEDGLLHRLVQIYGHRWNKIAIFVAGRTDAQVAARWKQLQKLALVHISPSKIDEEDKEDGPDKTGDDLSVAKRKKSKTISRAKNDSHAKNSLSSSSFGMKHLDKTSLLPSDFVIYYDCHDDKV